VPSAAMAAAAMANLRIMVVSPVGGCEIASHGRQSQQGRPRFTGRSRNRAERAFLCENAHTQANAGSYQSATPAPQPCCPAVRRL
jgi:hypothetical protein